MRCFCYPEKRAASVIRTRRARSLRHGVIPRASAATRVPASSGHTAEDAIEDGRTAGETAGGEGGLTVGAEIAADTTIMVTAADTIVGTIMAGTHHNGVRS